MSVRNTSSSVGWRSPRSSTAIPSSASSPASARDRARRRRRWARDARASAGPPSARRRRPRSTSSATALEVARVGADDVQLVAADLALERRARRRGRSRARGRRRRCRRRAGRPPRGTASSAGSSRRSSTSPSSTSHSSLRARGSRPGGRLVEEQDLRRGDQRRGEVEPAAHAARVVLGQLVGGVGERELLEQLVGARPSPRGGRGGAARRSSSRFSRPVSSPSTVASCAARPMLRRTATGSSSDVVAGDAGAPGVGRGERGEDAHGGGLAGAVGAEQRRRRSRAATSRSTPSERGLLAVALDEAVGLDRSLVGMEQPAHLAEKFNKCKITLGGKQFAAAPGCASARRRARGRRSPTSRPRSSSSAASRA